MGRPKAQVQLSEEQIEELASMGCSDGEIAVLAQISERTLQRGFDTLLKRGRASLRERLRRKQIDRALNGSDTMLIWLGKQYLDQRDKAEHSGDPDRPLQVFDHRAVATAFAQRPTADRDTPSADESDRDG